MTAMFLLLLALGQSVSAWLACSIGVRTTFTYYEGRLATSYQISGGSIGGEMMVGASLVKAFDNASIKVVLPATWSRSQHNASQTTIGAVAGCDTRTLKGVLLSPEVQQPVLSFNALLDLLGGSVAWSIGSQRMFPGTHVWEQFIVPREGAVIATDCPVDGCVLDGTIADLDVSVVFSPYVAGVGVPAEMASLCDVVKIHGSFEMKIDACASVQVCRDSLCVPQVYTHGITNTSGYSRPVDPARLVIVGFDLLETYPRDMMVYFTGDRLRVAFLYSSWQYWQTSPLQVFITVMLGIMAGVFVRRPLVVEVKSRIQQRILVYLNIFGAIFLMAVVIYEIGDLRDGILRSTGADNSIVMTLTISTVAIMCIKFLILMYADTMLLTVSPSRDCTVRIFFSSMLCTTFIVHCCGANERDWQSYLAAGASLVWLYVIPRDVATVFITYGAVWPFFCSIVLLGLLYPFVVFVGLQTASDGILGIMDTSILPTSVVFAYLISLYGIYSSIESAIEILGGL